MKIATIYNGIKKVDTIAVVLFAIVSLSANAQTTTTSTECGQIITYPNDGCGNPLCSAPLTITNNGTQVFNTDNDTICVQESSVGILDFQGHNNNMIRFCGTNQVTGIGTNFGTGNAFVNTSGSTLFLDYTGFGHTNHLTITNYGTLILSGSTNYDATTIYNVGSSAIITTNSDFIVNGDDSIFMIGGTLNINGLFTLNNSTALFCLSDKAFINAIDIQVNSPDEIHVDPGSRACIRYTGTANAFSPITEDALDVCMGPAAVPIQGFQSWGPNVTVAANCNSCIERLNPLPIKLQSFVAKLSNNNTVMLQWTSSEERNTYRFEIERSGDGVSFEKMAIVNASGFSNTLTNYNYTDYQPLADINYYRLKMIDIDGKFEYSPIKLVTIRTAGKMLRIMAVTASNMIVGLPQVSKSGFIRLMDQHGHILWQQNININQPQVNIPVSGMAAGIYVVQYNDMKTQESKRVFIQK